MRNFYTYSDELEGKMLVDQIRLEEPDVPIVSNSQINSWNKCGFQWHLSYVEKWEPREKKKALELGSLGHEDLAVWYTTADEAQVQEKFKEHYNQHAYNDNALTMLAEESWLVTKYIHEYSPAADRGFTVLAVEEHFIIALWTPRGRKYYLQGYVDVRGIDPNGQMLIWDHKFSGRFWNTVQVMMDPQLPLYAAAYKEVELPIFGAVHNMLNTYEYKDKSKVTPEKLFKREFSYFTNRQLENTLREVGLAVDHMLDHQPSETRRRLSRDCEWCWFQGPCLMGLRGHGMDELLAVDFKKKGSEEPEQLLEEDEGYGSLTNIHL